MTLYDLIFLGLLAILGFWGYTTGALKQIVNLGAFFIAIALSAMSKSFIANAFHLDTITAYVAAFIILIVLFIGLRYLGHSLTEKLHKQKAVGYVDRAFGVAIGILWTLTIIGVFHLIFSYITPIERQPSWFVNAKVYPLSVRAAKTIQAILPKGNGMAEKMDHEVQK